MKTVPVYRVSLSENLVQASYMQKVLLPEAVCCCLQQPPW